MDSLYTAEATAKAGRDGSVKSKDGVIDTPLTLPKGLGGPGGPGTNPEQLFACGYAGCFGSALKLAASQKGVKPGDVSVTAKVHIFKHEVSFKLAVELVGHFSQVDKEVGQQLMEAAHKLCPYSKATRNNIDVTLSVA